MPGFRAYMKEKGVSYEPFFLGFDPHWSPLGNRIAADIILESQPDLKALDTSVKPANNTGVRN